MSDLRHKSYYWIKVDHDLLEELWQPARWLKPIDDTNGHWETIGADFWWSPEEVEEVGPRIVLPDKDEQQGKTQFPLSPHPIAEDEVRNRVAKPFPGFSNELQRLLEEVADICDSGRYRDMKDGADIRYDESTCGQGLLAAYRKFLATKEGEKWYEAAIQENHRAVFGDDE